MTTKRILLTCTFMVLITSFNFGQVPDLSSKLTKEQMYKDFDEFVQIIDSSTQALVRKIATKYDAAEEIRQRRSQIEKINSYGEFIHFLNECLPLTMSVHARMAEWSSSSYIDTQIVTPLYHAYRKYVDNLPYNPMSAGLGDGFYFNGDYYIYKKHTFFNRKTPDTTVLSDFRVITHNDKPFNIFMSSQINGLPHWVRWDYQLRQYYHVYAPFISRSDKITAEDYTTKKIIELDMKDCARMFGNSLSADIIASLPKDEESDIMKVRYYDSLHILYIYMGAMNEDNAFVDSIKKIGTGKRIDKIIWDVRDNHGGGDQAWWNILQAIIKKPLTIRSWISFRNTQAMRKILEEYIGDENRDILKHKVSFLNNTEFLTLVSGGVNEQGDTICFVPDTNSLKYDGKIYILQNEFVFSAAGTLLAYAQLYPQLITVGVPTGLIMGRGISPDCFQLPESKFTFIMEAYVDLTECKTAFDVFHDRPEIEIYPTLNEIIEMNRYGSFLNKRGDEFLFKHDYLFKKVLEMK